MIYEALLWIAIYTSIIAGLILAHYGSPPAERLSTLQYMVFAVGFLSLPVLFFLYRESVRSHVNLIGYLAGGWGVAGGVGIGIMSIIFYEILTSGSHEDDRNLIK